MPLANQGGFDVVISPAGTLIAYLADGPQGSQIFIRPIDELEARPLLGTESASDPFFSPDGRWIGFESPGQGKLLRVAVEGGPPLTFSDFVATRGAMWGTDDVIVYATRDGLWRVSAAGGGAPERLTPESDGADLYSMPRLLPGGHTVLFSRRRGVQDVEIAVMSLDSREETPLLPGDVPYYAASGHLVFVRGTTLMATPFDVESLELRGEPVVVLEGVRHPQNGAGDYAVSDNGTLVFVPSSGVEGRSLVWVDRQGQEEPLAAPRRAYAYPRLSPDGTQVALDVRDQENDIWIWDLARETLRRLTFDPGLDRYPVWTPDGQRVALSSLRGGVANLFWKAADGTGEVERLTDGPNTQFPHAFSPDGTRLVYRESAETLDLGLLSVEGDRPMEPLLATEFNELNAELSPDGLTLGVTSDSRLSGSMSG